MCRQTGRTSHSCAQNWATPDLPAAPPSHHRTPRRTTAHRRGQEGRAGSPPSRHLSARPQPKRDEERRTMSGERNCSDCPSSSRTAGTRRSSALATLRHSSAGLIHLYGSPGRAWPASRSGRPSLPPRAPSAEGSRLRRRCQHIHQFSRSRRTTVVASGRTSRARGRRVAHARCTCGWTRCRHGPRRSSTTP